MKLLSISIALVASVLCTTAWAQVPPKEILRVVVFGAHPDDPESGCGSLIGLLARRGHDVRVAYGNCFRHDRKIAAEPEAVVRRCEITTACHLLGATPQFFDFAHEKLQGD